MISLIAAITADRNAIGRNGDMLHHLSADLRHFRQLTTGNTVVMGRKTFESLPKGALPDRRNIVVTRNPDWKARDVETAPSLVAALAMAGIDFNSDIDPSDPDLPHIYIIGGGQIYAEAMPLAQRLDLTIIEEPTPDDADTFFPEVDTDIWKVSEFGAPQTDERSGVHFRFISFVRK